MNTFAASRSSAILSPSTESKAYALFAVAIGLTAVGAWLSLYALRLMPGLAGLSLLFLLIEVGLLLSAPLWIERSPLNYVLFGLFPLFSGFTLMPYLLWIVASYANGAAIILNALAATATMTLAGAVAVRGMGVNLSGMGRGLFFALLGLIVLGLLQLFIPALRTTRFELMLSGMGVVVFALFAAYDMQRIANLGKIGANPVMLALSLYLDIYNLFLYVLRFMTALSGDRR
jgi:FtsH-binding integral membrane protein